MKQLLIFLSTFLSVAASAQCDTTINNTVSAITVSSATVSTGTISGALNYRLKYVRTGFTDTAIVDGVSNIKSITGLQANTVYRYYFTVTCASGTQRGQRLVYSFRTLGSSIVYTPMTAAGYEFKYGSFDSGLHVPNGDTALLRGKVRSGGLRYRDNDSSLYVWTGFRWLRVSGSGGSNIIAGNQLVRSGDTLGLRSSSPGASNALWFNPNLGSFAAGFNNVASGINSVALGSSKASGSYSAAIGNDSKAEGSSSIAMGISSTASGQSSIALGEFNTASAQSSVAIGEFNTASGTQATALGYQNNVTNQYGFAVGATNTASGVASSAIGKELLNPNNQSLVIGNSNDPTNNVANDVVFQVARNFANRFEVRGNGQLLINDGTQQSGYVLTSDANGATSWQAPASGADSTIFATQFRLDTVKANRVIIGSDAELRSLHITGPNGAGRLELRHQASLPTAGGQTTSLYANSNGNLAWKNDNLHHTTLATNHITADRSYRFQNKSYTLADSADVLNRADSTLYTTAHDLNVKTDSILAINPDARPFTATNNSGRIWARNQGSQFLTSFVTLSNTNGFITWFSVDAPTTLSGVSWFQSVQGNYTASTGFNGIVIYQYRASDDSLIRIAQTATETGIWQRSSSAGTWQTASLASSVNVQPGLYFFAFVYNQSSQTTAPIIGATVQDLAINLKTLPNGRKIGGVFSMFTATPPASIRSTAITASSQNPSALIW